MQAAVITIPTAIFAGGRRRPFQRKHAAARGTATSQHVPERSSSIGAAYTLQGTTTEMKGKQLAPEGAAAR